VQIIRTGKDFDHLHPTCTGTPNSGWRAVSISRDLRQNHAVARYQKHDDHDLRAIYEYLSAIPASRVPQRLARCITIVLEADAETQS